ncbi:DUF4349 domain-containing protein [Halorussus salilacus]|uniref:DUF4349 domain-containing protein n=1 Tax=Halorussus salilacus TaxID=2953750 RepID=UPI0020A14A59|nr:DUF4349 domain-containing protein [Halorussus salilacus]USZ68295.1 DUF4349 domain-containing protein [Halorussus salilacus]
MSRSKKRLLVAVALASLVVLAGCSGSGGDAGSADQSAQANLAATEAQGTVQESDGSADDSSGESAVQNRERELIRTGEVSLRVESFDESRRNLTQAVESRGGFVGDTDEQVHNRANQSWTSGRLVLRVPAENFSAFLDRVKDEGGVRHVSTDTEDVTDQLVDIEARLENLRSQREQLRELYEEANDTETVLDVQERLSEVQTEIERLEAQQESLQRQVAYSTITVEMDEKPPEPETTEPTAWYETGLLAAFLESVSGVGVATRALAVGTAYAAPYVLAFGVPLGVVFGAWRRRRAGGSDAERAPEPADDGGTAEMLGEGASSEQESGEE